MEVSVWYRMCLGASISRVVSLGEERVRVIWSLRLGPCDGEEIHFVVVTIDM